MWETLLMVLGPYLLQKSGILGGGGATRGATRPVQETTTTTEEDPRGYQSPWLPIADTAAMDQLLRQMQGYSGAGMPGGVGNMSPAIGQLIELIGSELPGLMTDARKASRGVKDVKINIDKNPSTVNNFLNKYRG